MKLRIVRDLFLQQRTFGKLYVDGHYECETLEDTVRAEGIKIPGQTAIPYGDYKVVLTWSARFKRILPLLLNVENFDGVRIHAGNTEEDTEGCILVGKMRMNSEKLYPSKPAFDELFKKLQGAASIELEIADYTGGRGCFLRGATA